MNAAMLCIEAASLVPRQRPRSRLPDSSADAADALHDSDLAWSPRTSRRPVKSSAHQLMRGECRAGALPLPEHQVRDVDEYIKCGMNLHDEDLLQNHRCAHFMIDDSSADVADALHGSDLAWTLVTTCCLRLSKAGGTLG
jgi:hypothetical protein